MAKRSKTAMKSKSSKTKYSKSKSQPKATPIQKSKQKLQPESKSNIVTKTTAKEKDILNWIQERKQEGHSDDSIKQAMLKRGYSPASIEEALNKGTVEKEEQKEKKVEPLSPQKNYETNIDQLHEIVENQGKISLKQLSEKLKLPIKQVEEWAKILNKQEMININYPLVGSIILTKKGFVEKTKDKKIKETTKEISEKPKKKSKKKLIILILIFAVVLIFILLSVILIKGGYLVIE